MPELPEVETTRRGIAPFLLAETITQVIVRNPRLRWPVATDFATQLTGTTLTAVERRGKYLLLHAAPHWLISHLGMSGCLRVVTTTEPAQKHDHIDLVLSSQHCLRFTDPRRFGCMLLSSDPWQHKLLQSLGPEPLSSDFNGDYLWRISRQRRCPVKSFIMDSKIVVGVGNIYAAEALFYSKIHPSRAAGRISRERYQQLSEQIKAVLSAAIDAGGTSLKDFYNSDGKPGYFKQQLSVYGRGGLACLDCGQTLTSTRLGQRATVYCGHCQR